MAKIILKDGSEEFLSPGDARAKVAAGDAVWGTLPPMYSTRQLVAEPVKAEPAKKRRKRKVKPVEEEESIPAAEQVEADVVE